MAKVQLTVEELLNLIRGEMNFQDLKDQLAKSLLDIWTRDETRTLIEKRGEELAKTKMERIIEDSFRVEKGYWNKNDQIKGWAAQIIREELSKATLPMILSAIKPELEVMVSELVQKELGNTFVNLIKQQVTDAKGGI